jgi:hypothetical protein
LEYVLKRRLKVLRLSISVVVGILESLTEATPSRIGHTYLRSMQETLHPKDWKGDDLPYFSFAALSDENVRDLELWQWLLRGNDGRKAHAARAGTLFPSFGDKSGTGTGGTVVYDSAEPLEMWMGTWHPRVYHFSSNWKELRTLLATLERAYGQRRTDIAGTTFFYFTDNSTTYFTVSKGSSTSPRLHAMVEQIKKLKIMMDIHLEVVHIPGTTIITECTDGLSWGIWISHTQERPDTARLLVEIFAPVPFAPDVQQWALNQAGLPYELCFHRCWERQWDAQAVFDRLTIWTPPPEVAPQLIFFLLQCHVVKPLTTAALIVIPRILQKRWSPASKHMFEVGVYQRATVPLAHHSFLSIPIVLLLIPYHICSLPTLRLDPAPQTALRQFHRQQAGFMRGVLETLNAH